MQLAEDISISKSFSLDVAFFSLFWNSESRTISLPLFLFLLSVAVVFLVFTGNRFSKNDYFENWGGGKYGSFFFCDSFARNRLENDFSEEEGGMGGERWYLTDEIEFSIYGESKISTIFISNSLFKRFSILLAMNARRLFFICYRYWVGT